MSNNWRVIYCPRSYSITCAQCPEFESCVACFDTYEEALAHFHKIRESKNPKFISLQYVKGKGEAKYDKL